MISLRVVEQIFRMLSSRNARRRTRIDRRLGKRHVPKAYLPGDYAQPIYFGLCQSRSQLVRIARPTSAQGSIVPWLLLCSVGWGRSPKFYYSMGQAPSIWRAYNDIAVHRTSHPTAVSDAYPL